MTRATTCFLRIFLGLVAAGCGPEGAEAPYARAGNPEAGAEAPADEGALFPMPEARYDARVEQAVRVPMRDGVRMSTDLYLPVGAPELLPSILIRTPYDKGGFRSGYAADVVRMFVGQGYAVAVQDKRGRFESEGVYSLAVREDVDGYDAVEWLAAQPWSNGRVGTYGCSDLGDAQVWMAPARPPALAAMIPQASGSAVGPADNIYRYFGTFAGGAFNLAAAAGWMVGNGTKVFLRPPSHVSDEEFRRIASHFSPGPVNAPEVDLDEIIPTLPLIDMMTKANRPHTDWESILTHDLADPWWDQFPYYKGDERIDVPSLFINSWHDFGVNETLWQFNHFREHAVSSTARENQFVVISPVPHCDSERIRAPTVIGERDLGDARYDFWTLYLRWYDRWLKGEDNGVTDMPRVQYYLMGRNEWRGADAWPMPGTEFTRYYLSSGGAANSLYGDGVLSMAAPRAAAVDRFTYDPGSPAPSMSGSYGMEEGFYDQRPVEARDDVLVYTSPPLAAGVEVTGPITATLYVSSDARDTDFTAKLVDVQPDGTAFFLQEGVLRARYREGFDRKVFMEEGEVYELTISLDATSNYFPAEHRIRLEVSSSSFPRFDRNLNTGGNNYDETEWVVARNAVHHSPEYPSHLLLPIVPDGASHLLELRQPNR
ncbi:CocE/NonD family hydrolase [Candidatus Palauibacter sp.]|uniref:CocE/NonD family hydrolase n=1 Tax=Candidatus Palauibacter sp. TaxID=3101350 RepID=UPI003B02D8EA